MLTSNSSTSNNKFQECMTPIFEVRVACSTEQPKVRMNIKDVVAEFHLLRKVLLETETHGGIELSGIIRT